MLVTKTKAAELAGVSRRTFYNHIPQRKISMTVDGEGDEKIDVSELERIYGKETIAKNLKKLSDEKEEGVSSRESTRANSQGSVKYELLLLEERIKSLEESKQQLETFNRRERDQLQDEIGNLRDNLKKAQDHQSQLSLLLTHQNEGESRGDKQDHKMQELEKTVQDLKKMNGRVLHELKAERSKGFFKKLFG